MDEEERHLAQADRHIVETELRVTEQEERVRVSSVAGDDTVQAERLLATLRSLLEELYLHRQLILDRIAAR